MNQDETIEFIKENPELMCSIKLHVFAALFEAKNNKIFRNEIDYRLSDDLRWFGEQCIIEWIAKESKKVKKTTKKCKKS